MIVVDLQPCCVPLSFYIVIGCPSIAETVNLCQTSGLLQMAHNECLPAVSLSLGLMGVIAIGILVVLLIVFPER